MLGVGFVPSLRVGEKDPKYDQYQRSNNPMPKVYYLSASQARPMLTTGVVRSGLVMTVLREDGTFTVEASILGGCGLDGIKGEGGSNRATISLLPLRIRGWGIE